jgi:hypothetical protein
VWVVEEVGMGSRGGGCGVGEGVEGYGVRRCVWAVQEVWSREVGMGSREGGCGQ